LVCYKQVKIFRIRGILFEEKFKVLRKHILHGENNSLGFIEAVHQWNERFKRTLLKRSGGTFFSMMGSMVCTLANQASGINRAHTTWHQPESKKKINISLI